jgi:hypothetical protein
VSIRARNAKLRIVVVPEQAVQQCSMTEVDDSPSCHGPITGAQWPYLLVGNSLRKLSDAKPQPIAGIGASRTPELQRRRPSQLAVFGSPVLCSSCSVSERCVFVSFVPVSSEPVVRLTPFQDSDLAGMSWNARNKACATSHDD